MVSTAALAETVAFVGDPARADMLTTLMDGGPVAVAGEPKMHFTIGLRDGGLLAQ